MGVPPASVRWALLQLLPTSDWGQGKKDTRATSPVSRLSKPLPGSMLQFLLLRINGLKGPEAPDEGDKVDEGHQDSFITVPPAHYHLGPGAWAYRGIVRNPSWVSGLLPSTAPVLGTLVHGDTL